MHNVDLIATLTMSLSAALLLGFLAFKLKLPPIVGYLVAGLIIGPHTPGVVANREIAEQLAEVGVILLMFGVGLHVHLKDLLAVRGVAITGALGQIVIISLVTAITGRAFGWSWPAGFVFGFALSVASTVVLMRVMAENQDLQSASGRIAIGWLVVEDVVSVLVLVLLPALFSRDKALDSSLPVAIAIALLKLIALTAITFVSGGRLVPRLLTGVARTRSRELFALTVLVIALGIAVGSAKLFGVSFALGAFLAGMIVGQSDFSSRAASEALPMQDAFAVLFFVSVGMLFDPGHILRAPVLTLIAVAIVVLVKPVVVFVILGALGYGLRIALRLAAARGQIGEFSFILAVVGNQLGIFPAGATDSLVAAAIVSITLNSLLYGVVPGVERRMMGPVFLRRLMQPRSRVADRAGERATPRSGGHRAVIVGYGPVGQTVSALLKARGFEATVVELNIETVRSLNNEGTHAVYGDATRPEILKEAGVAGAVALVISSIASPESADLIRAAREMNPDIHVFVRCAFSSEAPIMRQAGADAVFSGEAEVAVAMIAALLHTLGSTPAQMDAERERARAELYGGGAVT